MRTIMVIIGFFLVSPILAGTISGFQSPAEVRELVVTAISEWIVNPDDATACGGGDCCPNTRANIACTGSGTPAECCTGSGIGTCNDEACVAFSLVLQLNPVAWADDIEAQLQFDGDWMCNSYPENINSNRLQTVCTAVSGTPVVDVADICSEIANRHYAPF